MKKQIISINISLIKLLLTTSCFFSSVVLSEITLDGSMGTTGSLAGPDFQITEDLGQRTSGNLFHSFGQFNINSAESATFSGSAGIKNVISRVTGGQTSTIDGTFRSTIPGANVYFLNPSGIIFGENASLDVQGSFHASTADYLKFKDGVKFETGLANTNPLLTIASPEAFGFLDDSPAPISVSGGLNKILSVPEDSTLSLIGGNISIDDNTLYAPSGQVIIASAGSSGEIIFNESGVNTSSFTRGGNIQLSHHAGISVSADAAGKVVIRGGQMVMDNAAIFAYTTNEDGGEIDVDLTGSLSINGGTGIQSASLGNGDSGDISIKSEKLDIRNGGLIASFFKSSGNSGNLSVDSNEIILTNDKIIPAPGFNVVLPTGIVHTAGSNASGNPRGLSVNSKNLIISNAAYISTMNGGLTNGADILINSDNILLTNTLDTGINFTGIQADVVGTGNGGSIIIHSNELTINNGANISASTNAAGNAGNIKIDSPTLILTGKKSDISSDTSFHTGNAGDISIQSTRMELHDGATLSTETLGFGLGGDITVNSSNILLSGEKTGFFTDSLNSSTQNAGNLTITADYLDMRSGATLDASSHSQGIEGYLDFISKYPALLDIIDLDSLPLDENKNSFGNGGVISLNINHLYINESTIGAITTGKGQAGNINIKAQTILITASHTDDFIGIVNQSEEGASGNAGNITINTSSLELLSDARISSSTFSTGQAGDINITADTISLDDAAFIQSASNNHLTHIGIDENSTIAKSGNILISVSDVLRIENGSVIAVSTEKANAGEIQIKGNGNIVLSNGKINTSVADGKGAGGDISMTTPIVTLDSSNILAQAKEGKGGNILISNFLLQSPNSLVSASSKQSTDGKLNLKPDTNISGSIAVLPNSLLNASEHLTDSCSSRSGNNTNSFVIKNRGGIPLSPNHLSPATFMDISSVTHHSAQKTKNNTSSFSLAKNNELSTKKNKNTHSKTSLRSNNLLAYDKTPCIQQAF